MTPRRPPPATYQCPLCKGRPGSTITVLVQPHETPYCSRGGAHKPIRMVPVQ